MLFASTSQAQVKLGARQYPLGPATLRRYPARHGARRRRCPPDPPPATPLPCWCIDSQIPELLTLAATVDTWWPEINAFVATGITNARTEGYNRLVKQVKRVGCG